MKKKRSKKGPLGYFFLKLLMIMKLSFFILCVSVLSVFASESYSQTTKLTLSMKNMSIDEVLKGIEDQSEYRFFYSGDINTKVKVSIETQNTNIQDILDELFQNTDIAYKIVGRQVALFNKDANEAGIFNFQSRQITGKVTNENGEPIPGATVLIKGTTNGTIADADGNFSLEQVPGDATLVFSFIGMVSQEIPVAGKSYIERAVA